MRHLQKFHLGSDILIIYIENSEDEVILMRIATHSQIY
ncbi:MAG: Unknown protein [uncultured Sulfurovum sp.]|uniref:Type II toxin-antitoxin system mRNA interferase toxin, RelE/StbE family n=1 Tax=uncultured Sulfurovum sp. TaxID=269237 RepID=A0A6S6SFC8_9BACT|nr:MAG: Unknown protein [uncultured Sulfurovum sp.]